MAESVEQFLARGGKIQVIPQFQTVADIPDDIKAKMITRINPDEIDRHREQSKQYQRVYAAKKRAARHEQPELA
jgi:hypothetical protein